MRNLSKYIVCQANTFKFDWLWSDFWNQCQPFSSETFPFSLRIDSEINIWTEINEINKKQTTKWNTFNLSHTRIQHKLFHMKIQVKYDLGLRCFYSQALPNTENTVQKCIEIMVWVPKSWNTICIKSNPRRSYVNGRSASLNRTCYIVSFKLFLTLVRCIPMEFFH